MHILLTGGAGDLGQVLSAELEKRANIPVRLDLREPADDLGAYINGSILDRNFLKACLPGIDCVVHIAAWHGIHQVNQTKSVYEFWDLNVTGTFNVFQAAVEAGVQRVIYISSTSIDDPIGIYGHTKVLGEEIARTYAARHGLEVIILRPRAFIPWWNKSVYSTFIDWAHWFWPGAVHINDVTQAVLQAIYLPFFPSPLTLVVDGAYDYSADDLNNWDTGGPGSTFRNIYPQYYGLAVRHGLNPALKPKKLDISETQRWLDYQPQYSLRNLLEELARYGADGPPPPQY